MYSQIIQKNIKSLLRTMDMNPTQLAEACGLAQPTVQRILSGEIINPKLPVLVPICEFFSISLDEMIGLKPISAKEIKKRNSTNLAEKMVLDKFRLLSKESAANVINFISALEAMEGQKKGKPRIRRAPPS